VSLQGFFDSEADAINRGLALYSQQFCNLLHIDFSHTEISCNLISFILSAASNTIENIVLCGASCPLYTYNNNNNRKSRLNAFDVLKNVNLSECSLELATFVMKELGERTCPHLQVLNISRIKGLNNSTINCRPVIEKLLRHCPSLRSIKAENLIHFTNNCLNIINTECPNIRRMDLSGASVSLKSLYQMRTLSNLVTLKATGIEMPTSLSEVHEFLKRLTNIRYLALNLHDSGLSNQTLDYLLKYCTNIEVLILGGRPFEKNGQFITTRAFVNYIFHATSLQSLVMDFCPLTDKEQIEQLKFKIRKTGRSAPSLILPIVKSKADVEQELKKASNTNSSCAPM
jgi:hypothetical protein